MSIPLLKSLQDWAHCEYLSDLRFLSNVQRMELRRTLERIRPETAALAEWNEALNYLANAPPAESPAQAKANLIAYLSTGAGPEPKSKHGNLYARTGCGETKKEGI